MTFSSEHPIGIIYQHNTQFNPLFDKLAGFGIPFEVIDPAAQLFNPATEKKRSGLVFADLSSPPYLSQNALGISQATEYLKQLEKTLDYSNLQVVNGHRVVEIFASKARQLRLFASLGLHIPATRVVSSSDQLLAAANELRFPILIKNNGLKEHGPVKRYESVSQLITALINNDVQLGGGKTVLLQEYITSVDSTVVRAEVLRREVSFARKISYTWSAEEQWALEAEASVIDIPYEIERQIERIAQVIGLDTGSVEYVVDAQKHVYFYGIGPHTSTSSIKTQGLRFDPNEKLAEFLEEQLVAARDTGVIDFAKNY
jgi:glutathione synthase/RimK-type ligase-like ATP-grasp enzyme